MTIIHGDCKEVMASMDANSIDAIVCDPPYGLEFMGKSWDKLSDDPVSRSWDTKGRTMNDAPERKADSPGGRHAAQVHKRANPRCSKCGRAVNGRDTAKGFKVCHCEEPAIYAPNTYAKKMQDWHEEWAAEAFRVLKPGAYLLAFGGTRTFHRMAVAIEDAGFEIRDALSWLYGSGFPKSHDVGKAIDRARNEDAPYIRAVCRFLRAEMDARGLRSKDMTQHFGDCHPRLIDHWAARDTDSQPAVPKWEQWLQLKDLLGFGDEMDAEVWRLNGRKGKPGDNWDKREVIAESSNGIAGGTHRHAGQDGSWGFNGDFNITAPATDAAKQWDGWGTALKPAWEPIIVARKPLEGTVANNVLTHGTGAINIDATRITSASCENGHSTDPAHVSLQSVQDDVQRIVAELRAYSSDGTSPSRAVVGQNGTSPSAVRYAGILARLYPNGVLRDLSWLAVQGSQGDCQSCRRFGDGQLRQIQEAAREGPPSLADALVRTSQALCEQTRNRDCRCIARPSSCDALLTVASWLDLLTDNYTTRRDDRPQGRWPANVLMDETAAALLDAQTGTLEKGYRPNRIVGSKTKASEITYGTNLGGVIGASYPDTGGASRFFYTAKASRSERNAGLDGMPERSVGSLNMRTDAHSVRNGMNTAPAQNGHPTVKPISLMRWLVRLVTPPGGTVLDPFMGSGTTGCAASLEGFQFIGIEREAEYVAIAERRIAHWSTQVRQIELVDAAS